MKSFHRRLGLRTELAIGGAGIESVPLEVLLQLRNRSAVSAFP